MFNKLEELIVKEPSQDNDTTFAGSLGLNMYQEAHKMVADVDKVFR